MKPTFDSLTVAGHPSRATCGTGYREIHTTTGPYAPRFVGEAFVEYATLFAAAPDLLEALIRLREWVRQPGADDSPENEAIIYQAETAIARAEGRTEP